ncbi:MAG: hypothetical protein HYR94_14375 [Chloroflexi bacterium]|nr:hypothetical protein [Chloroflexota bacterium]
MSKIPKFANEQDEAEFWATHDASDSLDETKPVEAVFVDTRSVLEKIWLQKLYAQFALVRAEAQAMTEAEIDDLLDEAIAEVRSSGRND